MRARAPLRVSALSRHQSVQMVMDSPERIPQIAVSRDGRLPQLLQRLQLLPRQFRCGKPFGQCAVSASQHVEVSREVRQHAQSPLGFGDQVGMKGAGR